MKKWTDPASLAGLLLSFSGMETQAKSHDIPEAASTKELLIYAGSGSEYGRSLSRGIRAALDSSAWVTEDLSALSEKIGKPKLKPRIVVLVASSDEDLTALLELKDWLEGTRVVLILPSESWGWINQAHRLRPRFLGFTDEDQSRVIQVLEKMTGADYP